LREQKGWDRGRWVGTLKVGFYLYRWDPTFTVGIPTVTVESYLKYGSTFTVGIPTVKVESYLKGCKQHGCFWFGCRRPWLALGGSFLSILCMNGLRKQTSGFAGSPFLTMLLIFWSARVVIGQEP